MIPSPKLAAKPIGGRGIPATSTTRSVEILKLRDDYRAKKGDKFFLTDFHDRVLAGALAPLKIIRPRKGHPLPDSKGDRRSGHGRGIEPPSRAFAAVSSRFDIAEKPNFSLPAFFGKIDEDFHLGRIKSDKNTAFLLHGWSPIGGSAPASRHNPHPAHNVDD
jgi:hypothetical protein